MSVNQALQHKLWFHRFEAAQILGILKAKEAVSHLIQAMDDEEYEVRLSVAEALGEIGSEQAVFRLAQALKDKNKGVRSYAARALAKIGSEIALLKLIDAWKNKDVLSYDIAFLFQNLKKNASSSILPYLLKMISTEKWNPVLKAISYIQLNCQFYNYEIAQSPPPPAVRQDSGAENREQTTNIFPNATDVKIFEKVERYYEHPSDTPQN